MKMNCYTYTLAFWLLTTVVASAQTEVYFFYDPACTQKFDYERVNTFHDMAYSDYYISTSKDTKVIFRVPKDKENQKIVNEIPVKPYMCADRTTISTALIKEINASRTMAYIVVEGNGNYILHPISSVATLTENQAGIIYNDPMYGFKYDFAVSKPGEILNKKSHKERNIFFEGKQKAVCLDNYKFKVISRHIETPIKHLSLISTIGVQRIYTTQGELRLKTINGVSVGKFIANRCHETLTQTVAVTAKTPTVVEPVEPIIKDTVGLSEVDKKLWWSRQSRTGLTARSISPKEPSIDPIRNTLPEEVIDAKEKPVALVKEKLLPGGIYLVKEKESLYTVSEKFGVPIHRLVDINNLNSYELGLNQALKVVDDGSVPKQNRNPLINVDEVNKVKTKIHVVEQGQTLYEISRLYGLKLTDVYNLNKELTNDQIDINQQLVVGREKM